MSMGTVDSRARNWVVAWAPIWMWAQPLFGLGWLVPAVLVVCLALLGMMLAVWRVIKELLDKGVVLEDGSKGTTWRRA